MASTREPSLLEMFTVPLSVGEGSSVHAECLPVWILWLPELDLRHKLSTVHAQYGSCRATQPLKCMYRDCTTSSYYYKYIKYGVIWGEISRVLPYMTVIFLA